MAFLLNKQKAHKNMDIDIYRYIQQISADKYDVIRKNLQLDLETFETLLPEFFKGMYIMSVHGRSFCPYLEQLDKVWHEFIIQTEVYFHLCHDILPSKTYIHHESLTLSDWQERNKFSYADNMSTHFIQLGFYYHYFGKLTEVQIEHWLAPHFLSKKLGKNLLELNEIAKAFAAELCFESSTFDNVKKMRRVTN